MKPQPGMRRVPEVLLKPQPGMRRMPEVLLAHAPKRVAWHDHAVGFGLAAIYVTWLLMTARSLGFARDEAFYFRAGQDYERWFELLFSAKKEAFDAVIAGNLFSYNHEHPPLMKDLFGLSYAFLHERHHIFTDGSTAFRFPGMCMGGLTLWVTYLFGARAYGRWSGLAAAVLLALMPRVFYNAHLACFDVPIMAMWTLCIYVYWRATQSGGPSWALATGVVYGLTLLTKHNAWIMPAVFVPHALVVHWRPTVRQLAEGRIVIPAPLVAMATIGPIVLYCGWPWLWHDPIGRLGEWFSFHMNHDYYNMEFLGRNYNSAPSPPSYMPVMILATVPAVTLALFAVGAFERARVLLARVFRLVRRTLLVVSGEGRRTSVTVAPALADDPVLGPTSHLFRSHDHAQTDLLFFLSMSAALAVFLLPKTPIFGGTKHWLPAYPFLALFAGRGFVIVAQAMNRAWPKLLETAKSRTYAWSALLVVLALGPLLITEHSHPFGLSTYVPLVGGTAGGADLGLNRQFWGFTTESLAPWLAKNAPRNASVYIHDTVWDAWTRMTEERRLRPDLRPVGSPGEGDFAIVHHELHMGEMDDELWVANGSDAPAYVLTHDGVPIISVYKRK
jgi:4-amino-4-deoxy-L-arabinose transferase-like glycosyltransferase